MKTRPDLRERLASSGFTPSLRDVPELLGLLDGELADAAEKGLTRVEKGLAAALAKDLPSVTSPMARARALRALGRVDRGLDAQPLFLAALGADAPPRVRREAVVQLGKCEPSEAIEGALLDVHGQLGASEATEGDAASVALRRAVVEALGKVGGSRARAALAGNPAAGKASLRLDRAQVRSEAATILVDRAPEAGAGLPIQLTCRKGLEPLLVDELGPAFQAKILGPSRVGAVLTQPLRALFASRLWSDVGFLLAASSAGDDEAVSTALTSELARSVVKRFTQGPARFRLGWPGGAHRRAATYAVAEAVRAAFPELLNDPREATWEAIVGERGDIVLAPRAWDDPRFVYRALDVPASSHPTIAAALAWLALPTADDVVWDPFCGAGTELYECAQRGSPERLVGSDKDPAALEAARRNLGGVRGVELTRGDAATLAPAGVTCIITNPPMGRRVERHAGLADALTDFIRHAHDVLAAGRSEDTSVYSRLVWCSPSPRKHRAVAEAAGFRLVFARALDMGGFEAELQVWRARNQSAARARPSSKRELPREAPSRPTTGGRRRDRG